MDAPLAQQVYGVQHVDEGAAEAVHAPDDDGVTGLCVLEQLLHPAALDRGLAPGGDIGEHVALLNPSGDEGVELQLRILSRCAHAGVSKKSHSAIVAHKPLHVATLRHFPVRRVAETAADPGSHGASITQLGSGRCLRKLLFFETTCSHSG